MKTALIPPIAHLDTFCAKEEFHLVLSHLLRDRQYYAFYRQRRLRGDWLTLDNGAHENVAGQDMMGLLTVAGAIRASEIVLPDTLFDARATVEGAERAMSYLLGEGQMVWGLNKYPRLMIVPQAKSRDEWETCFNDLVGTLAHGMVKRRDLFGDAQTFTVGVSKDYETFEGGIPGILTFLQHFRDWLSFDVHLLGWGRDLLMLANISRDFPWVRSTDSAKPFVYAINGIALGGIFVREDVPVYPGRHARYFDTIMSNDVTRLARANVDVFREFANQ